MKSYIEYIRNLEYPEYSDRPRLSSQLVKFYAKNGRRKHLDLTLLDLSLGQQDELSGNLIQAISQNLVSAGKYSHTQDPELLRLISRRNKIPKDNITITAGCDGALRVLSQLLIHSKSNICIPVPSFGRYEFHTKVNKGNIHFFSSDQFPYQPDIQKLITFTKQNKIDVLFLANPNNPTGTRIPCHEIELLLRKYKGYIILDEALIISNRQSCRSLLEKYPKLIITRSFSKLFGLAGLRIGYVICSTEITSALRKLISPFEVSSVSILIAIAVLKNKRYELNSRKRIEHALKILNAFSSQHVKITPTESATALISYNKKTNLFYALIKSGIKTISCKDFRGLENTNCVRISVKDSASVRKLLKVVSSL